jgi:cysteine desulfurase/selenocysteine lyase
MAADEAPGSITPRCPFGMGGGCARRARWMRSVRRSRRDSAGETAMTDTAANHDGIDWAAVRARYPGASASVFLNSGSRGLLSRAAAEAGHRQIEADMMMTGAAEPSGVIAALRGAFARLIGAEAADVALTRNVSDGLNAIGNAVGWREGDEVVLCRALEHANNVHLWEHLGRKGIRIVDVPAVDGAIDAEAFARATGPRARVVSVSAVTMAPGFRAPLAAIGRAAHAVGALFLVDAVQATGQLAIDVAADGVDALVTSGSKGLLAPRGLGFLYVNPSRLAELTPVNVARNSYDPAGRHYSETGGGFSLHAGARRFECGHYNVPGATMALVALNELNALGPAAIERRVTALAGRLADGLAEQGWPVLRPPKGSAPSHLVCVGRLHQASSTTTTGDASLDALADALRAAGVQFAIRRGALRFGFHIYNDESDVAAVLGVAQALSRQAA